LKILHIKGFNILKQTVSIDGKELESVLKFTYLRSDLEEVGDVETDVNSRLGKSVGVFQQQNST